MSIRRFEDVKAWALARKLTRIIYDMTSSELFAKDFALKNQIQRAAGSVMHNIAEGFDSESNGEFRRFLRYSKRSCSEVQSQLYIAMDRNYINAEQFESAYRLAGETRATITGFIKYLDVDEKSKTGSSETMSDHSCALSQL